MRRIISALSTIKIKEFEKAGTQDFDANASFKSGKLSTYSNSQMNYYYMFIMPRKESGSVEKVNRIWTE